MKGYVYVMISSSRDCVIKIGGTQRHPTERAKEINTTGVPFNWVVADFELVSDWKMVEALMHERFAANRVNDQREFFSVDSRTASRALREIASLYGVDEEDAPEGSNKDIDELSDSGEVIRISKSIREQTKKLFEGYKIPEELFRNVAKEVESKADFKLPVNQEAVQSLLSYLEERGEINQELRDQLSLEWTRKIKFHTVKSVTPTCAACGTTYTVTMVRYEEQTRCPNCRTLSHVAIRWD